MTEKLTQYLEPLCNAHGVSGYEEEPRDLVQKWISPWMHSVRIDALGNLIAIRRTKRENAPLLLLDAHLDEVGLVISYIEPGGFLRFTTAGGWDERVLPAHAVTVKTVDGKKIRGVIGTPPPHILKPEDRTKPFSIEQLFIDVGARDAEEIRSLGIAVGDSAVPDYPFCHLTGDVVMGKALDDRAGCTVLIRVLEELFGPGREEGLQCHVAAVFSTFEEVGGRGAQVAAYDLNPQVALVLEGTIAGDTPGVAPARNPSSQGRGPALTLMDRTAHLPRRLVGFLQEIADDAEICHQLKTPTFGGTNAARIHMVRAGVPTGIISVPCRYIHGPHATLRLGDMANCVTLATNFVRRAHELL